MLISFIFRYSATVTTLNENILSPSGSIASTNTSQSKGQLNNGGRKTPSEHNTSGGSADENAVILRQNHQIRNQFEQNNNNVIGENGQTLKEIFSPSTEINRLQILNDFNQESMLQQPRNRLGLLISPHVKVPSPMSESTPVQTPSQSRSKQGSPFYAEPADALAGDVIRRSQRNSLLPKSQRHSEPPKAALLRPSQFCQVLSPIDSEKSHHISGSLDELKKKSRGKPPRSGRLDPWPVDSSWEFMINDDQNDYDTDANWKPNTNTNGSNVESTANIKRSPVLNTVAPPKPNQDNRITINQIIAKRLPELNIPELLQKTAATHASPDVSRSDVTLTSMSRGANHRLSAYDNVERGNHSGYATSLICHDSANSDDGTVFSGMKRC